MRTDMQIWNKKNASKKTLEKKAVANTILQVMMTMVVVLPIMGVMIASANGGGVETNWSSVYQPLLDFLDDVMVPLMAIVGSVGALYCVFLGVKFAKAEDPQEHEKAKKAIINAAVGFITLFILLFAAHAVLPIIDQWLYTSMNVGR